MQNDLICSYLDVLPKESQITFKNHPYINEKIIVDILNGVLVAKDLNDENKKHKFFDSILGKNRKRNEQINDLLINAIEGISKWLKDHEEHLSIIEYKIITLANELIKTQDEILKFFNDYKNLKENFLRFQAEVSNRLENHEERIKNLEIQDEIDFQLSRIGNLGFDIEIELFIVLDNIFSGKFALWYYNANLDQRAKKLEYIFNLINKEIKDIKNSLVPIENFYKIINKKNLPSYEIKAIKYISSQYRRLNNKRLYDAIDLYKLATNAKDENEFLNQLKINSHIKEFITYEEMVKDLGNYFLNTWSVE